MIKEDDLDEGRKATPLKGHPYHEKSDAELHYIIKDAGEAARAGKGLSSEGKYLDQVNDASTVLYHRRNGGKQLVKKPTTEDTEIEEALVAKATLDRYRSKAKAKFREKGGINAALDKQDDEDHWKKMAALRRKGPEAVQKYREQQGVGRTFQKEEVEPLDELSPKTLGSYVKKAAVNISAQNAMSHSSNRVDGLRAVKKSKQRQKGIARAVDKITKEDMHIVDALMMQDEVEPAAYIASIEARCNAIVEIKKDELKKSLFDLDEARKPKPGTPGGSWVDPAVADRFKKEAKEKKQFASAKREIDKLKKKGK